MIRERETEIRDRVTHLLERLPKEPQYPTQGRTLFVDLEKETVHEAYTPIEVVKTFLGGRGSNMFYLYNLVDPSTSPLDPGTPLIFGSGVLTGLVPSAARGNVTSWSPETEVLMDSNAGDFFPSFMKLSLIDHIVLYGKAADWSVVKIKDGQVSFDKAGDWAGLDNMDLRDKVTEQYGKEGKEWAMVNITVAGENLALNSGIMAGPKAIYARGGTGAKMGSLNLKAILIEGVVTMNPESADEIKPENRVIAKRLLGTSVVKNALKKRGTPFLYKPSRILGAMGTKNNQETTWTDALDAENFDKYRPGMAGCFRCPVNCRPLNDLGDAGKGDKYDVGDGPEYVTLGKFGPNIGIKTPEEVLRLNNICNDLGLDTASTGSAIGWAMELYQRGIITTEDTGGLELNWGDADLIEKLLFMLTKREGFGDVLADSAAAVRTGKYPEEAAKYRMTVKGLFQSDPHDARILKAFALGLGVATRGMDHLRNRVTLEINARINDDAEYKKELYGGTVAAAPNAYEGKELAVRACENIFGVGDSVGMCRFTTKLFNSPNLPDYENFSPQVKNVTGIEISIDEMNQIGLNINGIERMINHRLGVTAEDDTLPRRWFEEPIEVGRFAGEKIDRDEFEALKQKFYSHSKLTPGGIPQPEWRESLLRTATGFAIRVKIPSSIEQYTGEVVVDTPVTNVGELIELLESRYPGMNAALNDDLHSIAVNADVLMSDRDTTALKDGDTIEVMPMVSGG